MALNPDEQAAVDQFIAEHGVKRCSVEPGRDRIKSLFWRRKGRGFTVAKASRFADDVSRLDHPPAEGD